MVLLGLGTGGIKATSSPFIGKSKGDSNAYIRLTMLHYVGDQYSNLKPQVILTKKGELVVTDRTLTLQYIYNLFYWSATGFLVASVELT